MKKIIFFILFLAVLNSCRTVPITGRRQFVAIPAFYMNSLALTSFTEVVNTSRLSTNVEQTQMIERVGNRIRVAVEDFLATENLSHLTQDFVWEFILIDNPAINAWVMPGARVAFYTGILPVAANEDGVAVIMAHEIAHAVANHAAERMSRALITQLGGVALSVALNEQPQMTQALALSVFGVSTELFSALPHSRRNELEADRLGLIFMAMAGYDVHEAPRFWQRMMDLSGNPSASDFLSTHPSNARRINEINRHIPEALKFYRPYAGVRHQQPVLGDPPAAPGTRTRR
ncbi:MAG: M48 family metallopeptidase [Bacteroidales bacterium]|nr:M48 family metallopeptidase [Bacteroidales bacterium]